MCVFDLSRRKLAAKSTAAVSKFPHFRLFYIFDLFSLCCSEADLSSSSGKRRSVQTLGGSVLPAPPDNEPLLRRLFGPASRRPRKATRIWLACWDSQLERPLDYMNLLGRMSTELALSSAPKRRTVWFAQASTRLNFAFHFSQTLVNYDNRESEREGPECKRKRQFKLRFPVLI